MADTKATTNDDILNDSIDKVEEYFKLKDSVRALRKDLKDVKVQMPETSELDKLNKKTKELRETIKDNENVKNLTEKISTTRERMELLKELIRIDLLDRAQEEVKRNGRKLKIVTILREMRDQDKEQKKTKVQGQYQSRQVFR